MKVFLIAIAVFFLYLKTKAQAEDIVWSPYDTSGKINVAKFSVLTKLETDFSKQFKGFADNRARLTLADNNNRIYPKELQKPDFPVLCLCRLKNDTIHITAALGLMAGLGITMTISKEHFGTSFFQEADNTNIFKVKKDDSAYVDRISISTVKQKLTLLKKPFFVDNENIIGIFEGQFKSFYELDLGTELTRNYRAKLFFKCKPRSTTN